MLQAQEQSFQKCSSSLLKELETLEIYKESSDEVNPGSSNESSQPAPTPQADIPDELPPPPPPPPSIPAAMNVLLNMDSTDISQEVMVYDSGGGVDSAVTPGSSSLSYTQQNQLPFKTPPSFGVNRSYSLPPRNFQSQVWHGAGRYSYSDYVSEM